MPFAVPVVIGVGDVVNRSLKLEDAKEPAVLIMEAIQNGMSDAATDQAAHAKLVNSIDSLSVVRSWTWPYYDLPGLLSEKLNINPQHREYTEVISRAGSSMRQPDGFQKVNAK